MNTPDQRSCPQGRGDELAAYALEALEPSELREFAAHLETCEVCREQLVWLQPAVEVLPASVEQLAPPPELGERLMATVRREATEAGTLARPQRRSLRERLSAWVAPMRPAALALAACAIVAAGVGGYALRGGEELRVVQVQAADPTLEAYGTLRIADDHGTLEVRDLPLPRGGEVYQVWIAHDDMVSPSSVFVVDHDHRGSVTIPELPEDADAIMITREPEGGSLRARGAPVMTAELD